MTDAEIVKSVPTLVDQMLDGVGHFTYNGNTDQAAQRRRELAQVLYERGLR